MRIISSKTLRNDYATVTAEAHATGEPIFVTKNGAEDIVVLSQEAYLAREKMLDERARVLEAEAALACGGKTYSLDEARSILAAGKSSACSA